MKITSAEIDVRIAELMRLANLESQKINAKRMHSGLTVDHDAYKSTVFYRAVETISELRAEVLFWEERHQDMLSDAAFNDRD